MANGNSGDQENLRAVAQAIQDIGGLAQARPLEGEHAMDRIAEVVSELRVAAQECGKAGLDAEQQLKTLAEDIEKETHHRLAHIISEARIFWADIERRMIGKQMR